MRASSCKQTSLPEELTEVQKRIKFIVHRMENAIANHEFEKARFYSDEERKERENLRALREKYHLDDSSSGIVTKDDIEDVVSAAGQACRSSSIKEEETQKLLRVEEELHKRVIAQDKAISALARAIRRSRAGLKNPARPIGSFLFLGPTGVGKTEVARTLAQFLFGSAKNRSSASTCRSSWRSTRSAKLIGSPPGYVGYEEGGQLTERVKRSPYSVVLLDEVEKAHPDVFNLMLQVFEDGQLTDGLGNTGRLQEHDHHHDLEYRRQAPDEARRPRLPIFEQGRNRAREDAGNGDERGEADLQPGVPQPAG